MEMIILINITVHADKSKVDEISWNIHDERVGSGPVKVLYVQAVYIPNGKTMPQ